MVTDTEHAATGGGAEDVPADGRCIWPGCTRRRAPNRTAGSGRQKEYCLKADPPESGGGPVHSARNRWAWQRREAAGDAARGSAGEAGTGDGQAPGIVRDERPLSTARQRAGDLLDQARRQHAAALAALAAEREMYAQVAEQFRVMADPASRDLEITAISLKAGRDISAAAEQVARAQRAQLTAEGERDQALARAGAADAAAEQLAEDTEAAERAAAEAERRLAERAAGFERELAERAAESERVRAGLRQRAEDAEDRAGRARAEADAARAAAEEMSAAAERARAAAEERARAADRRADSQVELARRQAAGAAAAAEQEKARARAEAEKHVAAAKAETAAARADAGTARAETEAVRGQLARARAEAERLAAVASAAEQAAARAAGDAERQREEIRRLGEDMARFREERERELARIQEAHAGAIEAERARARRAEEQVDALVRRAGG